MPNTIQRLLRSLSALLVVLLMASSSLCHAFESIEFVTPERAKELGLEIRTNAAGSDTMRIELEFAKTGELKDYSRVALEMHDEGKLLLSSTLRDESTKPDRIVVSFAADRSKLDKITLKIVTQSSLRTRVGHVLKMPDFVTLAETR